VCRMAYVDDWIVSTQAPRSFGTADRLNFSECVDTVAGIVSENKWLYGQVSAKPTLFKSLVWACYRSQRRGGAAQKRKLVVPTYPGRGKRRRFEELDLDLSALTL
jgi:hypothetical protein